jgi:hypothetical protein
MPDNGAAGRLLTAIFSLGTKRSTSGSQINLWKREGGWSVVSRCAVTTHNSPFTTHKNCVIACKPIVPLFQQYALRPGIIYQMRPFIGAERGTAFFFWEN